MDVPNDFNLDFNLPHHFYLNSSEITRTGRELGRGAYGRVFEVNYEGKLCAAKEVHTELLQSAQEGSCIQKLKSDFLNECQTWSKLTHPSIVQFLGM